ncbi:MAG TPA: hypothetical protein DDW52_09360 [Planctomycetaceae bacterium]|nr:hypothetical protein [Planctomycetaceae bacterium]
MDGDPYSLDKMRDIAVGQPISWWPPAPAWFLVLSIAALLAGIWMIQVFVRYRQNRFRRIAMSELSAMKVGDVRRLSELLKRVALVSYPNEEVASLSGKAWVDFLRQEAPQVQFGQSISPMETATTDPHPTIDSGTWSELIDDARVWILQHKGRRPQ